MTLDEQRLAEKAAAVERHLRRVAERLPAEDEELSPDTDASDAVVLHLWQATQLVIDVAVSLAVRRGGTVPATYADAFDALHRAGVLDAGLRDRLIRTTGFRNVLVHAYEDLDMARVRDAARHGPDDLRAFLRAARDALPPG